jgi:hypothetical protein
MEKKLQFWEISKKKFQNFHDFHEDSILAKIRDFSGIFRDFYGFWNPGPGLGFGISNLGFKIPDLMESLLTLWSAYFDKFLNKRTEKINMRFFFLQLNITQNKVPNSKKVDLEIKNASKYKIFYFGRCFSHFQHFLGKNY